MKIFKINCYILFFFLSGDVFSMENCEHNCEIIFGEHNREIDFSLELRKIPNEMPEGDFENEGWSSDSSSLYDESEIFKTTLKFDDPKRIPYIWQSQGTPPWSMVRQQKNQNYKLRSAPIHSNEKSIMLIEFISEGGSVEFDLSLKGEANSNVVFYINDEKLLSVDMNQALKHYNFELPDTDRVTLKWEYKNNSKIAKMGNYAYIDNLTIPSDMDTDFDGFNDAWELKYVGNLETLNLENAAYSLDGDMLTNLQEYKLHTHPDKEDTDGDMKQDHWEVARGFNPNKYDTYPIEAFTKYEIEGIYRAGLKFIEEGELEQGYEFILKAAKDFNHEQSQAQLSKMYYDGTFVDRDTKQAEHWYSMSLRTYDLKPGSMVLQAWKLNGLNLKEAIARVKWAEKCKHISKEEAFNLLYNKNYDTIVAKQTPSYPIYINDSKSRLWKAPTDVNAQCSYGPYNKYKIYNYIKSIQIN